MRAGEREGMLAARKICASKEDPMSAGKRGAAVVLPLLFGIMALMRVVDSEEFDLYRRLNVVQLLSAGFCFGIAFMALVLWIKGPRKA